MGHNQFYPQENKIIISNNDSDIKTRKKNPLNKFPKGIFHNFNYDLFLFVYNKKTKNKYLKIKTSA
jgi:hypothetical protein